MLKVIWTLIVISLALSAWSVYVVNGIHHG